MTHAFPELVVGGVLVAPFVSYAVAALAIIIILRPVLRVIRFAKLFSHPSVAELSLYVVIPRTHHGSVLGRRAWRLRNHWTRICSGKNRDPCLQAPSLTPMGREGTRRASSQLSECRCL